MYSTWMRHSGLQPNCKHISTVRDDRSNCSMQHSLPPKKKKKISPGLDAAHVTYNQETGGHVPCIIFLCRNLNNKCTTELVESSYDLITYVQCSEVFCELLFTVAPNCFEMCCWQRIKQRYSVHAKHQIKNIPVITRPVDFTVMSFGYFCEVFCITDFEKCSINGDYWDCIILELGTSPRLCV